MKIKTADSETYFNPHLISHVYLNSDGSLLTVHFVDGSHSGFPVETEEERASAVAFLKQLIVEPGGFATIGHEVLNLKAALWIAVPDEGPIQIRLGDNRTRMVDEADRELVLKRLAQ
jgi:hypothetical protein